MSDVTASYGMLLDLLRVIGIFYTLLTNIFMIVCLINTYILIC